MTVGKSKFKTFYLQPAFLICVSILAIAAGTMSFVVEGFTGFLKKVPLPLKKSLDLLNEEALAPYKVVTKKKISNEDVVIALGTEDYIQWILEDPAVPADSAVRKFLLFITYYGLPDRVPHVPEECYTGGGYQRLASDSVTFEISKTSVSKTIRGKYLVFGGMNSGYWNVSTKFPVLYLFRINEDYAGSRDEARIALNKNLFGRSSYFCKIELVFNQSSVAPSRDDAVTVSQKVLNVILPVLEKEHWPDWRKKGDSE